MKLSIPDATEISQAADVSSEQVLDARLYQLIQQSRDPALDSEQQFGATIAEFTAAIAVFLFDARNAVAPISVLFSRIDEIPESVYSWCVSLSHRTLASGSNQTETSQNEDCPPFQLSASPAASDELCLLALHQQTDAKSVEHAVSNAWPALLAVRQANRDVARQLAALQDLIARTELAETREAAAAKIAENMADYLQAEHVAVAVADENARLTIAAVSDNEHVDEQSEQYRLAMALLQEAVCRHEVSVWPAEGGDRQGLLCHRQYAEFHRHAFAVGCPLFDGLGKLRGALLLTSESHLRSHVLPFLKTAQTPLATAIHLVHRAEQNRWWRKLRGMVSAEKKGRRRMAIIGTCLVCAVLGLPLRYTIKAACRLEPSQKRYIAAPFDGKLLRCYVEPGDHVTQGQLLARLDGQETQWELGSVNAELQRAQKERAGYIASHESGKARLAQHEIEYLESKAELLTDRVAQLEVRSPEDGIVVSGDLTKAEGVPLEVGQTLFEIAPLDAMIAEVAVAEDDIRFVQPGQLAKIRFHAFPHTKYPTELRGVRPRSESRHEENVFVALADIPNLPGQLRPGMEGNARIKTVRRPLGWILFHKPAAAICSWLGV